MVELLYGRARAFRKLSRRSKEEHHRDLATGRSCEVKSGEAVIVDVRETDEWDEEHIPGAIHMSRGTIELDIEEKFPTQTQ